MSDQNREHRPLLCDDYSDEEFHVKSNKFQKRNRISFCNGRARIHAKGAAVVIARWPDIYCSTTIAYWWFGLIMFTVTIFVIYNCVQIFGMIPAATLRPFQYRTFNKVINPKPLPVPVDVFMHLIVNNDTDINLNRHLQHANMFAKKYPSLKFTFLVLINDTSHDELDFNNNHRNEIALNSLWTSKINDRQRYRKYNVCVEHVSLTAFFNASPVKKFWRHLPQYLIEFLVRSISIWDKGGIAFSPLILASISDNTEYIKNMHILLQTFEKLLKRNVKKNKTTTEGYVKVNTRRPNNIRDIINELDKENYNVSDVDLSVADNNEIAIVVNANDTFLSKPHAPSISPSINTSPNKLNKKRYVNKSRNNTLSNDTILPLFLKYIFKNTHINDSTTNKSDTNLSRETQHNSNLLDVTNSEEVRLVPPNKDKINGSEQYDHLIISVSRGFENDQELTLDIKGNIIASKTACHAFLGTIFSNIIHHTEEKTLTDFIITELSLFCNGLLTSCAGINVILV